MNSNEPSYKICSLCNNLVDANNIFNIKGEEICKTCVEKKLEEKEKFSPIATFICSLIPGAGHIYLNKKEKGLFLFGSFIFINLISIISLVVCASLYDSFYFVFLAFIMASIVILLIPTDIALFLYSVCDANFSRKYIEDNTYKEGFVDKLAHKVLNKKDKKFLEEKIIDKRLQ